MFASELAGLVLRSSLLGVALLGALSQSGCAHEAPARPPDGPKVRSDERGPVRWAFHPRSAGAPTGHLDLGSDQRLEVDEAGTRWLVEAGKASPAASGVPEGLVGAAREAGRFAFIGDSGTVYFSDSPLGPLTTSRPAPLSLVRTAALGSRLLGVSSAGQLLGSDDLGLHWARVPLPGFAENVQLSARGDALVLTLPERWFTAAPGLATFEATSWASVAPFGMARAADGSVVVRGLLGSFGWDTAARHLVPRAAASAPPAPRQLSRFVGAAPLRAGEVVWAGASVVGLEASQPGQGPDRWVHGDFGGPLEVEPRSEFSECGAFRVAAAGLHVHLLCADRRRAGVAPPLHLWSSADSGRTWVSRHLPLRGAAVSLELGAHESGGLAISGICPAETSEAGCQARGIHWLAPGGKRLDPLPFAGIDEVSGLAFLGDALWALGVRAKDRHLLLQSVDGWRRDRPDASSFRLGAWVDVEQRTGVRRDAGAPPASLLPGRDALGVTYLAHGSWQALAVSVRGELLGYGPAPGGTMAIAGAGTRLLALDARSALAWESRSGGLDWQRSTLPRALCDGSTRDCKPEVFCVDAGCWVGDELVRHGWGAEAPEESVAHALGSIATAPLPKPVTVAYCRFDGAEEDMSPLGWPSASDAALGDAAFAQLEFDPRHASAQALRARFGQKRLEREVLLAPAADPERFATAAVPQIEGSAVLRHRVTKSVSERAGATEVAWDNRISGVVGHGSLPNLPALGAEDLGSWTPSLARARPALLSVAGQGLFLRFHGRPGAPAETYWFEAGRVRTVPAPRWPEAVARSDFEFVRVGDVDVPLGWLEDGRIVVSQPHGSPSETRPLLLLPQASRVALPHGAGIAYTGTAVSIFSWIGDAAGTFGSASVVPLSAEGDFGAPLEVPLLAHLKRSLRGCSERERRTTPRVVAPVQGVAREVLVEDAQGSPLSLLTARAVLHGTPSEPCVAAFEAEQRDAVPGRPARYRALWFPGTGQVSWLFRQPLDAAGPRGARALSCSDLPAQ